MVILDYNLVHVSILTLAFSSTVTSTAYRATVSISVCRLISQPTFSSTVSLPSSTPLQEVQIPVVGNKQCSCNYIPVRGADITDRMICAGQENKGACQVNIIKHYCCI